MYNGAMDKSILMQIKDAKQWYIDFDYTLFDTGRFRDELYKILYDNGFDESYLRVTDETKKNPETINVEVIFERLANERGIAKERFLKPLHELYARGADFTYDDSRAFIEFLKARGATVNCFTFGDKDFQLRKIAISGLSFDEIIPSGGAMKFTLDDVDYVGGVFVDDSVRDLNGLYNRGARRLVRVRRPNTKNFDKTIDINVLEVASLKELMQLMQEK